MTEDAATILVVEDDPGVASLERRRLERAGYRILVAASAEEALARLREKRVDLVVLDNRLPGGVEGLDLYADLKASGFDLPVIVVTGDSSEALAIKALRAQVRDYVSKAADYLDYLPAAIERVLRQVRTEQRLAESEARLATIVGSAMDAILAADGEGRITLFNPAAERMFRCPPSAALGQPLQRFVRPSVCGADQPVGAEPSSASTWEGCGIRADGEELPIEVSAARNLGTGRGFEVVVARDITERRRAEEELRDREEQLRSFITHAPAAMAMFDRELRYLAFSNRWLEDYRLGASELLGRHHYDVFPEIRQRPEWQQVHQRCLDGESIRREEDAFVREDGSVDWLRWDVRPWRAPSGEIGGIVMLTESITERKRAEEALRQSEQRFRQIADNIQEVFWMTDPAKDEMLYVSPAYETIWGRTCDSLYAHPRDWLEAIHPDDRERVRQAAVTRQADGAYDEEYRIVRPDGSERWIHDRAFPVRNAAGDVYRIVGVAEDVTPRRSGAEEHRRLESQLREAQKMEAVGRLAGGVAHDFNNMLNVIIGRVELALGRTDPSERIRKDLDEILKAAQRSADLTRQLLAFARKQTANPKLLDLNEAVAGTLQLLRRLIGENIELAFLPGPALRKVKVDPSQIDQLLANLALNARDAIDGVGMISIETVNAVLDDAYCAAHPGSVPGEYVLLSVSDDGCGMDEETLAHVFEPFFTTKGEGKGTGLGLATVYGVVQQNDGVIDVSSTVGHGSSFRIYLPRVEAEASATAVTPSAGAPLGGAETLLLVEDERALLEIGKENLEELGYAVLAASTPAQAIHLAQQYQGVIDLILTDVVMPEMNGRELAERVRSARPGLKCLYMSGYTADVIAHRGILDEGVRFLQKPFSVKELADKVREAIDA